MFLGVVLLEKIYHGYQAQPRAVQQLVENIMSGISKAVKRLYRGSGIQSRQAKAQKREN